MPSSRKYQAAVVAACEGARSLSHTLFAPKFHFTNKYAIKLDLPQVFAGWLRREKFLCTRQD
jgi:hypothetical protein